MDYPAEGGGERERATPLWTDVEVGSIEGLVKDVKEITGDDCVQPKVLEGSIQGKVGNT